MRASAGPVRARNAWRGLDAAERRRLDRRLAHLLARHGLRRGPRPAGLDAGPRWADFFAELGPVAAAFARYLSHRPDLRWLDAERASLARLDETLTIEVVPPDVAAALSACRVEVASRPELADWSGAWFRAELSGRPIRLFLQRPGLESEVEEARAVFERLAELSRAGDLGGRLDLRLVDDFFAHQVRPRLDLENRRRLFERLRSHGPDILVVPEPVAELEPALGRKADAVILVVEESAPAHGTAKGLPRGLLSGGPLRSRGPAAARLLAACFVDILAETGLLATDLQIARLDDGRAFLLDATCLEVTAPPAAAASGKRILDFLRATASERPREIVELWRQEIDACGLEEGRLRSALRQATPRRQFASGGESIGETTAEYALAYWRAADDAGLELGGPWRAASVAVEGLRRRFAEWDPEGDALAHALVEQSWRESWRRLRSMATPRHVSLLADRYAAAFLELPSLIDRVLDLPDKRPDSRRAAERRSQDRPAASSRLRAATPYLLALASISLVANHFGELRGVETAASVAFMLLSLSLLRVILR